MLKLAYNKEKPWLVFEIDKVIREQLAGGIVEYYVGSLTDTSTDPDTTTANYKVQVVAFESKWADVPVDLGSTGDINNQAKTVDPTTSEQTITADTGYTGLSEVKINAVGLDEAQSVTPTTSSQTISPTGTNLGLAEVTVNAVTAAIDANIVAENIKQGVTILGVEGTYTGE